MSKSIREQLESKLVSGQLRVTAKPALPSSKKAAPKVTTPAAPKPAAPWHRRESLRVVRVQSSASAIAVVPSARSPEIGERLNYIERQAVSTHEACTAQAAKARSPELLEARRGAEKVLNYCRTVREGLVSRDLLHEHLPEVSSQLHLYLEELSTALNSCGAVRPERIHDVMDGDSLKHYRQCEIKLQRMAQEHVDKPAFMMDMPVLAIFTGVVTPERLLEAGLPVEKLGGYPVLLNQRVIALRTEYMEQKKLDKEKYLKNVLAKLDAGSDVPHVWTLVTDVGTPNKKYRVMLYWVMPQAALSSLNKAAGSPLRNWDLAF